MNMILQKFFILAFICHFTAAAPADVIETTDVIEPEIETESVTTTTTDTTTIVFDIKQNEVDAKFNNAHVETTTTSDIDSKVLSIEADSHERTSEKNSEVDEEASTLMVTSFMDELDEVSTTEHKIPEPETAEPENVETSVTEHETPEPKIIELSLTEKSSQVEETTESAKLIQATEEIEQETPEPEPVNPLTRIAAQGNETAETSTTENISTVSESVSAATLEDSSTSAVKASTESSEIEARRKLLIEIRKMLRAHLLRTVLTTLNEAKKRQVSLTQEQHAMESQIVEESIPAVSGSECECEDRDDAPEDDEKVIAFDRNSQRYVYMDKEVYKRKKVRGLMNKT